MFDKIKDQKRVYIKRVKCPNMECGYVSEIKPINYLPNVFYETDMRRKEYGILPKNLIINCGRCGKRILVNI